MYILHTTVKFIATALPFVSKCSNLNHMLKYRMKYLHNYGIFLKFDQTEAFHAFTHDGILLREIWLAMRTAVKFFRCIAFCIDQLCPRLAEHSQSIRRTFTAIQNHLGTFSKCSSDIQCLSGWAVALVGVVFWLHHWYRQESVHLHNASRSVQSLLGWLFIIQISENVRRPIQFDWAFSCMAKH